MAVILEAPAVVSEKAVVVPRKLWTNTEYCQLIKDGFLQDGKVELVKGEIWEKMGQGRLHSIAVTWLVAVLGPIFGFKRLQCQSSLPVTEFGNPEPDLAVLAQNAEHYRENAPGSADTLLVVEAFNTTLQADLTAKVKQYGGAGIPECWVVDIPSRLLHVFREPTEAGYASETVLTPEDEVRPLAAPDAVVRVADLLP